MSKLIHEEHGIYIGIYTGPADLGTDRRRVQISLADSLVTMPYSVFVDMWRNVAAQLPELALSFPNHLTGWKYDYDRHEVIQVWIVYSRDYGDMYMFNREGRCLSASTGATLISGPKSEREILDAFSVSATQSEAIERARRKLEHEIRWLRDERSTELERTIARYEEALGKLGEQT